MKEVKEEEEKGGTVGWRDVKLSKNSLKQRSHIG